MTRGERRGSRVTAGSIFPPVPLTAAAVPARRSISMTFGKTLFAAVLACALAAPVFAADQKKDGDKAAAAAGDKPGKAGGDKAAKGLKGKVVKVDGDKLVIKANAKAGGQEVTV